VSETLKGLLDDVRSAHPVNRRYLFFPGYFTPNGELHLGHVGGPYLRSDVTARVLRIYGADVRSLTASDCYESGVTYASVMSGAEPAVIADTYTRRAALALSGLDIDQAMFLNGSDPAHAETFAEVCQSLGRTLAGSGRLTTRTESLFTTGVAYPRYSVAAFVGGDCPFCGSNESGNVCERCGMWLPPETMDRPWRPDGVSTSPGRLAVRSVFAHASPDLAAAGPQGRVEPTYAYLARDYVSHYGPEIRMTLPLPWGVPWQVPGTSIVAPTAGSVHSSYVTGKYASTRLVGQSYAARFGVDPFSRDGPVTTAAFGGLDSAMGWLALLALTGPELDFRPFDYTVINRFMLLRGSKFSTSRRHVIRVNDALGRGLSSDAVRLALARVSPSTHESDFVPEDVAKQSHDDLALLDEALHRCVATSAIRAGPADQAAFRAAALDCLLRQRAAFALPKVDLPAAVDTLMRWAGMLRDGQLRGDAAVAREVLAVLAYPLIPRWGSAVWRDKGADDTLDMGLSAGTDASTSPVSLRPLRVEELADLIELGRRA
jgi:methionyl-tRNA synthetase